MTGRRAVVVGSGPNGLVGAITLAGAGWDVEVLEAADEVGGGTRTAALVQPGVLHDICSAIHPLSVASPALRDLPLAAHGLTWVYPEAELAHPLDGGRAAVLHRDLDRTAEGLGPDARAYRRLFRPFVEAGTDLTDGMLSPLTVPPRHPATMARFGPVAVQPAARLARSRFEGDEARALFGGMAGHSILPLNRLSTAGYGLMLGVLGHLVGWPMAEGGSQAIARALVAELEDRGGSVTCGRRVVSLAELGDADAVLFDTDLPQVVAITGDRLPPRYRRRLLRFRNGPGVHKVDWVLDGPIPWENPAVGTAATVHVCGTLDEVVRSEREVWAGDHPQRPLVLLAQQSQFDRTRAPAGTETAWAYCHVPNGSTVDMTERIEAQVERFSPGFRDRITGRHVMGPAAMQDHNANYRGGDIAGGVTDLRQFVARPTLGLHPWRTPAKGIYLCSSSTPPGGGVHGMCGWHAAQTVLHDHR